MSSSSAVAKRTWRPAANAVSVTWTVVGVGCLLLGLGWLIQSLPVALVGVGVTSIGALGVPVALIATDRLRALPRWQRILGFVLLVQLLHTVEHAVQAIESIRLDRPGARSLGVVSSLNVEWVHFGWNWLAWSLIVLSIRRGLRGRWTWTLLVWVTAHSLEHTYMLFHYLAVLRDLDRLGLPHLPVAEVLPGILGRDGWLSLHIRGTRGILGPIVAAPRLAVHFWWNAGELTLLALTTWRSHPHRKHRVRQPERTVAFPIETATVPS